jgi:hypothetical protein
LQQRHRQVVADEQLGSPPYEAVIERCRDNLDRGIALSS